MTKIYLVYAQGCTTTGALDLSSTKYIEQVYTNKKLAEKCVEYLNQEWQLGFARNADFKKEQIKYHYVKTEIISHLDYSKIPY